MQPPAVQLPVGQPTGCRNGEPEVGSLLDVLLAHPAEPRDVTHSPLKRAPCVLVPSRDDS